MSGHNQNQNTGGHHHHRDGGNLHQQQQGGGGHPPLHHQHSLQSGGVTGGGSTNLSKENKSFNDRFRAFFKGLSKGTSTVNSGGSTAGYPGALPSQSSPFQKQEAFVLTDELLADLSQTQAVPIRLKALQIVSDSSRTKRLEPFAIEKLWTTTSDLFSHPDAPIRHAIFATFTTVINCQFEKAGFLRARLFSFIKGHDKVEDTQQRFQFLKALSENGRDVSYFEEKIGIFLLTWMMDARMISGVPVQDFMEMLTNLVKFHCSFLDDDVLGGIIQNSCMTCLTTTNSNDTIACINLLSNIVMYAMIPPSTLQTVIATLCRTVNNDTLCKPTWKVMRNLLGTHLGHSGLYTLIMFLENESSPENEITSVIRGAVFFTGVVLWGGGNRVVRSLLRGGSGGAGVIAVVLASYVKCLGRDNALINYEVLMRVQDLVKNNADSLQVVGWDLVLEIMGRIIEYSRNIDEELDEEDEEDGRKNQWIRNSRVLVQQIHDTLDGIEAVLDTKTFCGNTDKYWELVVVEGVCHSRPIPSVEKLQSRTYMKLLNASISKTPTLSFMKNLTDFTLLHFQTETRVPLRLKALTYIQRLCIHNQDTIEEQLLDNVILPNLKNIELEPDLSVRNACVSFIVDFLMESRSKKGHDLLHYLEKVVNRPFELHPQLQLHDSSSQHSSQPISFSEPEVTDIILAVKGIVKIFQRKLYSLPSSIAVTAYKILVRHLSNHYKRLAVLDSCSSIRYMIFECFFRIRANALYHLGFPNEEGIIEGYSCYLAVDHAQPGEREHEAAASSFHWGSSSGGGGGGSNTGSGSGVSPPIQQPDKSSTPYVSYISLTAACKQVICCLKKERDWKILELVLLQLPHVMENKALILSKHGNDVDVLASHLCSMVTDKSFYDSSSSPLRNTPRVFSRSDFQAYVFPALTSLVSYHSSLGSAIQQQIVKCLEHGLVSKSSRICISALTTCTLEMKEVMHKLIPEILLSLSKISPKLNIAVPVLEFLSTLIHLPRVFASFVQDQYMSIFAICLPYTNPFKFNHYVVSLAHHVIALWFLKCRLSYRKAFVSYIIKGLESNVWAPFQEAERQLPQNEDSSNRKRSSSLTDNSNRRRERMISGQQGRPNPQQPLDHSTMQFHQELTETCVDLMARYAFADCSPLPSRFQSASFLTNGGTTQSWMIDNRIITISTSGCSQRELREGLCDRCWMVCRQLRGQSGNQNQHQQSPREKPEGRVRMATLKQRSYEEEDASSAAAAAAGGKDSQGVGVKRSYTISGNCSASQSALRRRHKSAYARALSDESENEEGIGGGGGGSGIKRDACLCWCQGWAEVLIRRPTGNTSWMMRVQNLIGGSSDAHVLRDLSCIYMNEVTEGMMMRGEGEEVVEGEKDPQQQQKKEEENQQQLVSGESPVDPSDGGAKGASKQAVKRSNSSPDMAKNPPGVGGGEEGEKDEAKHRCEAIPEENKHEEQMTSSTERETDKVSPLSSTNSLNNPELGPMRRDRMFTISVMTPARRNSGQPVRRIMSVGNGDARGGGGGMDPGIRSGISPSFVFLQLCGQGVLGVNIGAKPLLLPSSDQTTNSLKVLDYIPPYETHKIGVLYVGPGQAQNEPAIFQNAYGSTRYRDFLQGLGSLIKLKETDPVCTFLGGLDKTGEQDGEFACIWQDDLMQVIFHVATLMPTRLTTDPNCNGKKRHIGNDFVAIVYNNSDQEFDISTIKCQFLYACVIIQPLDHRTNRVFVKAKPNVVEDILHSHTDVKIVSDQNLPVMARQMALHSNLASVIHKKLSTNSEPYASNWLERLRAIKRLRARVFPETVANSLSLSTQELSSDLNPTGMMGGINPVVGAGGAAGGAQGTASKRPSFVVEDFTEYV